MLPFPHCFDFEEAEEVLCLLESMAQCAFYLAGDDRMNLKTHLEQDIGMSVEEFNPKEEYERAFSQLDAIVGGYNYRLVENNLPYPTLCISVDWDQTVRLKEQDDYFIWKILIERR